jgi:flagellar motility protein MotE (MotC chaperone)
MNISNEYKNFLTAAARGFVFLAAAAVIASPAGSFAAGAPETEHSGRHSEARAVSHAESPHKSSFISKIDKLVKSGDPITAERFERLKTEIVKLRERMNKRVEQIDKKIEDLTKERARIKELLVDLSTSEVSFYKIKIYSGNEKSGETEAAGGKIQPVQDSGSQSHK